MPMFGGGGDPAEAAGFEARLAEADDFGGKAERSGEFSIASGDAGVFGQKARVGHTAGFEPLYRGEEVVLVRLGHKLVGSAQFVFVRYGAHVEGCGYCGCHGQPHREGS